MTSAHGKSTRFIQRQVTLTKELDDAVALLAYRDGLTPSGFIRKVLIADARITELLVKKLKAEAAA